MPLALVLGPANSAKAGEVLGGCAAAAGQGALLVVPNRQDVHTYARELAERGAVLGGAVVTFAGLIEEIGRRSSYRPARLSALQRERVVRRALARADLRVANRSQSAPGFATAALRLVSELERSLITPERFSHALRSWAIRDSRRRDYAHDLATVYNIYARELRRRQRVDGELFAWGAIDALAAQPELWGGAPVFVYGFDDLTPAELYALQTLSGPAGAAVTVSLTWEPERVALRARGEAVQALRAQADSVRELPALADYYEPGAGAVLHHLERHLFEPGPVERRNPGAAVRLLEAGGERAEIELVAAEVLALLDRGVSASEIAVIYRSVRRSGGLVRRVFEHWGIPATMRSETQFGHTALGRGLIALARCALLGAERVSAAELITYLRTPGAVSRPEFADGVEATVRREGIRTVAEARARTGLRLAELDLLAHARDPLQELGRQARRLFSSHRRGLAPVLDRSEELDGRALAVLLRALDQLSELHERLSATDLLEMLEQIAVPVGEAGPDDAVLVAEPLETRARRFRVVFVCGLQESEFPHPGRPDPFLSDELRRELAAIVPARDDGGALHLRAREDTLEHERYLFYASVTRATEQVVLSYRSSDEEGNIELPSPFIADVAELLDEDWPSRRRRRLLADVVWAREEAPTSRERWRTQAAHGTQPEPEGAWARALGDEALAHVRHRRVVSAGALETYASCPVKWLVERELQPRPFAPDPDPIVRGSVIHAVLEKLYSRLPGRVTEQSLKEAQSLVGELLREHAGPVGAGQPPAIKAGMVRSIEADLNRFLAVEARALDAWPASSLELRFGFDDDPGSLPALELAGEVRVRGVIDRVDVEPAEERDGGPGRRALVRDYKSGGTRPAHFGGHWQADRQLQVPLYMLAVRELLDVDPVGGFYQPLGGEDLRPRGVFLEGTPIGNLGVRTDCVTREELEDTLENTAATAVELAAGLRAGLLRPCPDTCSRFGCAHPGICRAG